VILLQVKGYINDQETLRGHTSVPRFIKVSYSSQKVKLPIVISNDKMNSLTIYLTLLMQNVESNPRMTTKKETFLIITYNCNGMGDRKKTKETDF
jgi:hypothetical protein